MGFFNYEKPKIVILDDDHYPEGRVSQGLMNEFKKRNIEVQVEHYKTFASLSEAIVSGEISKTDLFVLDSSLDDEPTGHHMDFGQTIPALLDMGIKPRQMMPASGGREGSLNNQAFEEIIERRGKSVDWKQTSLTNIGLSGNPYKVADKIIEYYGELNPKAKMERESVLSFGERTSR